MTGGVDQATETVILIAHSEARSGRYSSPGRRRSLAFLVLTALSAVPGIGFLAGVVHGVFIADADFLFLHELLVDLGNDGSVRSWNVPYATYLFPDWPLYTLALVLAPTPATAIALFATLQMLLLAGSVWVLASVVGRRDAFVSVSVAVAVVAVAVLGNAFPIVYVAASFVHGGTAILSVLMLGLVLRWIREPDHRIVAVSAVVTIAGVASDRLFVVWGLMPALTAVGASLMFLRRHRFRIHATWIAAHGLAAALALPVPGLLFPDRSTYDLAVGFQPLFGLRRVGASLREVHEVSPAVLPVTVLAIALVMLVLVRGRSLAGARLDTEVRVTIATYGLALAGGTIVSQVLMTGPVPPHARYSIAAFLLPLVVAPIVVLKGVMGHARGRMWLSAAYAIPALALLFAAGSPLSWLPSVDSDRVDRPVDCVEAALEDTGSARGIASYWDARPFQVYSEGRLVLSEFGPDLRPMTVNSNDAELADQYDFAIVSPLFGSFDLPPDRIRSLAGPPATVTECGPWTVLDYGPDNLDLTPFGAPGTALALDGCALGTHVGTVGDACQLRRTAEDPAGFLVHGPYAPSPPGVYTISVRYRSPAPASTTVGTWEVAVDGGGQNIVATGDLRGTDGEVREVEATVNVDHVDALLQWRLVTPPVDLTIDGMRIERLR